MTKVAEIFETMEYGPAPEDDKPARAWIDQRGGKFVSFINGKFVTPGDKPTWFPAENPATGEKLGQVYQSTQKDVDAAVKAARAAQENWAALPGFERAKYLYAITRLMQKHARLFAVLETLDNGKPIRESRDIDVPAATAHFHHHAGWAQIMDDEFDGYEPYGVAGQIIPWNFPLLMLAWKVAPALATGNTVVLKPAEQTNLTAQLFAEICVEAGLPKGVFNLVTGDGKVGAMIVAHDGIDKLAFTGSTDIGRLIRKESAGSGKALTLELGGKSPYIVFDDADIDSAVEGLVDAIWFNQGEVCCAGSRLLVQESIYDSFVEKLKRRMQNLRVGNPMDKCVDLGAVVDKTQLDRITKLVDKAVKDGAEIYQIKDACPTKGCFYPPTILTNVEPSDEIAQIEVFGPVLSVISFRNQQDAVAIANNTRFGLAATVWTENINMALEMAPAIKAGVVWINSSNRFYAGCGFGGYRESGYGREGGKEGLYAYLKPSYLSTLSEASPRKRGSTAAKKMDSRVRGNADAGDVALIDRTAKNYIGGKQKRPDGNYSMKIVSPSGVMVGEVGEGNRKDIRDAVEAASGAAAGWAKATPFNRGQILYYIAENLSARADEFAARIKTMTDCTPAAAKKEVELAIQRLFYYAGWTDKHDGAVHTPPLRGVTLAMNEPIGVMGLVCPDDQPFLSFISLVAPAIAMGNACVVVPSSLYPLAATDFYQVLETSDVPGGVINIVTGDRATLTKTIAEHDGVDALWYFGADDGSAFVEAASVTNLKQTWCDYGLARDWTKAAQAQGREYLRRATQVKNIWVPYGESSGGGGGY
ncbi:aldehyde dehydrogenase family protein [Micavibrio aeruginosavorus]|nr:aldehyde dehydrogenase family protein [Micavibrio aeruginosavorus]